LEEETKVLTTPWLYAGLKYRERLLILNKHTSSTANLNGILECCSVVFGVSRDDITGSCRKQEFAMARHAFAKLARDGTEETFSAIAEFLGKRNHATAMNSYTKACNYIDIYPKFRDKYEMCSHLLKKAETIKDAALMQNLSDRIDLIKQFEIDKNEIKIDENEPIIRDKRSKTT
tara:strand:- start:45 stop:569 length:525 start_codon:yes stop_codon:yes gene_type:complete